MPPGVRTSRRGQLSPVRPPQAGDQRPDEREDSCGAGGRGLSRRAFLRAQAYMEGNIGERLSLADIAGAAHLSRSHFARAFRVTTGLSVMGYLRSLRIERAKTLLIEHELRIAELSAQLGFAHHSHFTRLFRREVGMAPSAYAHLFGLPVAACDARAVWGAAPAESRSGCGA